MYYWGMQLEAGSFATSYIPTTTAPVTRNADVVTVPTTGWSASSGTLITVAEHNYLITGTALLVQWSDGTANNRIQFGDWSTTPVLVNGMSDGSLGWNNPTYSPSASNNYGVSAMTYTTSLTVAYWNGIVGVSSAGRSPSGLQSTAAIGSNQVNYYAYYDNPIQRLIVYSSALSSSDTSTVTNNIKDGP
jgi:hypothetical protein